MTKVAAFGMGWGSGEAAYLAAITGCADLFDKNLPIAKEGAKKLKVSLIDITYVFQFFSPSRNMQYASNRRG